MLSFHSISIHYGARYVIDHLDLTVHKGDFVVVVGPVGSGKSTLISALLGIGPEPDGQVLIDGLDVRRLTKVQRRQFIQSTGIVLQQEALLPARTVKQNLLLTRERESQVQIMLQFLHLTGIQHQPVRQLSFGERKLVDLGRSLMSDPRLILWDSPFQFLDTAITLRMINYLSELHRSGKTIFMTTSQEGVADEFRTRGARVLELEEGKMRESSVHSTF